MSKFSIENLSADQLYQRFSRRFREGLALPFFGLAVFMLLALFTYSDKDPGWSHTGSLGAVIANAGGRVGAWLADFFIYLFGSLSYCWPLLVAYWGWIILRERLIEHNHVLAIRIAGFLLTITAGSGLLALHVDPLWYVGENGAGGLIGDVLMSVCLPLFGRSGSDLLMVVLFLTGLTLFADISWLLLMDKIGHQLLKVAGFFWRQLTLTPAEAAMNDLDAPVNLSPEPVEPELKPVAEPPAPVVAPPSKLKVTPKPGMTQAEPSLAAKASLRAEPVVVKPETISAPVAVPVAPVPVAPPVPTTASVEVVAPSIQAAAVGREVASSNSRQEPSWDLPPAAARTGRIEPSLDLDIRPLTPIRPEDLSLTASPDSVQASNPAPAAQPQPTPSMTAPSVTTPSVVPAMVAAPRVAVSPMPVIEPAAIPPVPTATVVAAEGPRPEQFLSGRIPVRIQIERPQLADYSDEPEAEAVMAQPVVPEVVTSSPAPVVVPNPVQIPASSPVPVAAEPVGPVQVAEMARRVAVSELERNQPKRITLPIVGEVPSVELLERDAQTRLQATPEQLLAQAEKVEQTLADFNVEACVVGYCPGPVITRFELELAPGIKVSKISGLAKDLARALMVNSVRVVEVIAGKSYIGLELPNEHRQIVRLREIIESDEFVKAKSPLTLVLGKDIAGEPVAADLARMPHLLVAGTTGSGKSVGINTMLISLLYKATPKELRLILIDPKMLELSIYEGIPHLLTPVVTDMKEAANALRWCVGEMERRYKLMSKMGVRNIAGYNKVISDAADRNEVIADPLWKADDSMADEAPLLTEMPYIVVVIDEFADMMMIVGKKVEELIARIAQKARAAGIHLVLATQRPSVDVITGLIKANVPTRVSFQVSTKIDSRTILDQGGAEQLLGHGDMLFLPPGTGLPTRVHGAFVDDHEVHAVVADWKRRGEPDYLDEILDGSSDAVAAVPGLGGDSDEGSEQDPLYDQAVRLVTETRRASISLVQRQLKIGYNRSARLIEEMERAGIVSSMQTNGTREVLVAGPPR